MINRLTQFEDLESIIVGKALGIGIHRKVAVFLPGTNKVIKIAEECPNINVLEDEIWQMVKDTNIAKWFAPCVAISPCGIYLIQERAETRPKSEYPKMIPNFFSDLKYANYGWIKGKFVCVDYASCISTSMVHKWTGKMKKADWWE